MKKLFFMGIGLSVMALLFSCGTAAKKVQQTAQKPAQQTIKIKKECQNYVTRMEKCLTTAKGKNYNEIWKTCEGTVIWDMLKEYQDNGFCFDEDECKQKVMDEINKCKDERLYLFRKYYRK